jgi:hypothetical protein
MVSGLHRFYLGKPLTGILYLLTGGLAGIGTIYDAVTMPNLVRRAQLKRRLDYLIESEEGWVTVPEPRRANRDTVEHAVLSLAQRNHGVVTPAQVALECRVPATEARDELERLVSEQFAEVQVTTSGVLAYVFPEFLDAQGRDTLLDMS